MVQVTLRLLLKYQRKFGSFKKKLKYQFLEFVLDIKYYHYFFGASTVKMHHGHRGANHPIKNLQTKNVEITVQNHGFVVSKKKFQSLLKLLILPCLITRLQELKLKKKPFFSVQYHPESSPGPQDSRYLFKKFENLLRKNA